MLLLFPLIQNSAWGQVAGKPSLTIEGSIALGTAATVSGLGVTGKISNTNNTICMIKRIDVQWGKVDTSNNNTFTAYSNFFNMTNSPSSPLWLCKISIGITAPLTRQAHCLIIPAIVLGQMKNSPQN
jgi:hypothetical protein